MFRWLAILALSHGLYAQSASISGDTGSVAGRVTDATTGEGIGGAILRLFPQVTGRPTQPPTTGSSGDGSFHFGGVRPGTYTLYASSPGFTSVGSPKQVITVTGGATASDQVVRLNPLGTVSGHVVDDNGRPVDEADVQLFRTYSARGRMQARGVGDAETGPDGGFTFKRVAPGRYFIAADADNFPRTFYAKGLRADDATPLELAPGSSFKSADITLEHAATYHVRGKIQIFLPGALQKGARLILAPRDSSAFTPFGRRGRARGDGSFDISGVLNGSYTLWLVGSYSSAVEASARRAHGRLLAREDLEVNGSDVNGIAPALIPPVSVSGRVTLESAPPGANLSQIRVNLQPSGQAGFGSFQSAAPADDGSFRCDDLDPGEYLLRVVNLPAGIYLGEAALNRQDVLERGLDLTAGGGGELTIVLRGGAGEVSGAIQLDHGEVPASGLALLVPETPPLDGSGVLSGILKPGGMFAVSNVRPGKYYAFAVSDWDSIWQNPDFELAMQRDGAAIEIGQNGHVQVQLHMLPAGEVETAAERLGLSTQ